MERKRVLDVPPISRRHSGVVDFDAELNSLATASIAGQESGAVLSESSNWFKMSRFDAMRGSPSLNMEDIVLPCANPAMLMNCSWRGCACTMI